jgi:hypothetical protein
LIAPAVPRTAPASAVAAALGRAAAAGTLFAGAGLPARRTAAAGPVIETAFPAVLAREPGVFIGGRRFLRPSGEEKFLQIKFSFWRLAHRNGFLQTMENPVNASSAHSMECPPPECKRAKAGFH